MRLFDRQIPFTYPPGGVAPTLTAMKQKNPTKNITKGSKIMAKAIPRLAPKPWACFTKPAKISIPIRNKINHKRDIDSSSRKFLGFKYPQTIL